MSQEFKVRTLKVNSQYLDATGNVLAFNSQAVLLTGQAYPYSGNPLGYVTTGQTGAFGSAVNTGILTGVFYPLTTNPSGYITTGQTGAFGGSANTGALTGVFYPLNSNPSGYANTGSYLDVVGAGAITIFTGSGVLYVSGYTSGTFYVNSGTGAFIFRSGIASGVSEQFIAYPATLDNKPYVIATLHNDIVNNILPMQISGVSSSGFWALLTDVTTNTGFYLDIYASNSTNTGLATNVIVQNYTTIPTWANLTWANPVVWTATSGVIEDRKILILTGSTTLSLTGLYNGWAGVLKVKQSGSGFTLGLPSGTKVINNASGVASLTTGISGAVDVLGFAYDGIDVMVGVGNNFN